MIRLVFACLMAIAAHLGLFFLVKPFIHEVPPVVSGEHSFAVQLSAVSTSGPQQQEIQKEQPPVIKEVVPVEPVESEPPPEPVVEVTEQPEPPVKKEVPPAPQKIKRDFTPKKKKVVPPKKQSQPQQPTPVKPTLEKEHQEVKTSARQSNPSAEAVQTRQAASTPVAIQAQPISQRQIKPEYPSLAKKRGWQGVVVLEVQVSERGWVKAIHIEQSSGYQMLDKAAVRAVKRWRFQPGTEDGVPVESSVTIPVRFQLH